VLNGPGEDRGFTKAGQGILLLGNRHSDYRGATTIQEGVLRLRNQFLNINSFDNNGPARIGDGTGAVNLSGGTLEYNGSPIVEGASGAQTTTGPRSITVSNPINVTADSTINYFSTTAGLDTRLNIDFIFTSDDIGGTGGTLSLTHNGACNANPGCTFRPTFTGDGFDFDRPVVISNHTSGGLKVTQLVSSNTEGTQTWSGDISGTGGVSRTGTGGATVLSGANTYAGGTTVDAGTLTVSGSSATFGSGDVTVTGGTLSILSGVANAIADTAALSISGTGIASLGTGIDDLIAALSLGGVAQTGSGTYGSSASGADFQFDQWFSGMGVVRLPDMGELGDFNEDGMVDAADYVVWRKNEGTTNVLPNDGGLGGTVGVAHFNLWRENFGNPMPGGGSGANAAVPEPGTIALLTVGVLLWGGSRRRRG
jgi:autotransporter-associated beta strand protein